MNNDRNEWFVDEMCWNVFVKEIMTIVLKMLENQRFVNHVIDLGEIFITPQSILHMYVNY